jgi:signal peptidase II
LTVNRSKHRWEQALLFVTAALVIAADQITKLIIERNLTPYEEWAPIPAIQRLFAITYITNTGSAFGLFPQGSQFFMVVAVVVAIAILFYSRQLEGQQWLLRLGLGLQLGGALGNLIDRLTRGHVVDFVHFKFWPVWNVADASIVVGVAVMAYFLLQESKAEGQSETKDSTQPDADADSPEQNLSAAP